MRLPDGDGLKLLEHVGQNYASTPVAVITAHGSAENAVAALKAGAFDYLAKPVVAGAAARAGALGAEAAARRSAEASDDKELETGHFRSCSATRAPMQQMRAA